MSFFGQPSLCDSIGYKFSFVKKKMEYEDDDVMDDTDTMETEETQDTRKRLQVQIVTPGETITEESEGYLRYIELNFHAILMYIV